MSSLGPSLTITVNIAYDYHRHLADTYKLVVGLLLVLGGGEHVLEGDLGAELHRLHEPDHAVRHVLERHLLGAQVRPVAAQVQASSLMDTN